MSLTVKRKQIVLAGLAVALATAMYVNWYYTKPASEGQNNISVETTTEDSQQVNLGDAQYVNASVGGDYFSEAQLKRSQAQDEAKAALNEIISSETASAESKAEASKALEKLTANIVLQSDVESLIKAKTGGEVYVSLGETAEIVLSKGTLKDEATVQIRDIITNKTEIPSEKITIVEVK